MIDKYTSKKIVSPLDSRDDTPLPLNSNLNTLNPDAVSVLNVPDPSEFLQSCLSSGQPDQCQHQELLLDEFHYHEIADRCHLINCMIDDFILAHPACNTQMQYWAEDAQRQLCNVMSMAAVEEEKLDKL